MITRLPLLLALTCMTGVAAAGESVYPSRPVRIVDPFPAGGVSDTVARFLGQKLSENLGQPVIIENRAGAGGTVGTHIAVRAAPDGHTLLLAGVGPLAVAPSLYAKLPYDPARDLQPITQLTSGPLLLVVHSALPVQSVSDLVALAKAKPAQLNFASGGAGTSNHLAAELFKLAAGIDIVHVSYKGAAPALTGLVAGEVQMMTSNIVPALPLVKAGRLRGLAVTSARRSGIVPDIPTIAEQGLPGYEASAWFGVLVPAKTPPKIAAIVHDNLTGLLKRPDVRDFFTTRGLDIVGTTPQAFAAYMRSETLKYGKVIKQTGIPQQ